MDSHFEQTSEKKFNRAINNHKAKCTDDLGAGRFANYYTEEGKLVARIDQSLSVFEILVNRI